jgi:hypothetical protein
MRNTIMIAAVALSAVLSVTSAQAASYWHSPEACLTLQKKALQCGDVPSPNTTSACGKRYVAYQICKNRAEKIVNASQSTIQIPAKRKFNISTLSFQK